jgi:glycosyltransferase involved in cell wall biosynthesis
MLSIVRIFCDREIRAMTLRQTMEEGIQYISVCGSGNAAAARNFGARAAAHPWIFFLDADCEITTEDLNLLIETLKRPALTTASVYGLLYARVTTGNLPTRAYNWIQRAWVKCSTGNLLGGALIVKRDFFALTTGFNETIEWAGEETEWLRRASKMESEPQLIAGIEVRHLQNLSWRGFFLRARRQGRSRGRYALQTKRWSHIFRLERLSFPEALAVIQFFLLSRLASMIGARCISR